jgi:hypothetical protein
METREIIETGCYLDNHRGHYIGRDAIQFAQEYGFIVGPFEQWAIDTYDNHCNDESYPHEGMIELCDDAIEWLNSGQSECITCKGTGKVFEATGAHIPGTTMQQRSVICKECSGSGRGPRIAGQNFPPRIPEGTVWEFNDGDFGLYPIETEDGSCPICGAVPDHLTQDELDDLERRGLHWWQTTCSH